METISQLEHLLTHLGFCEFWAGLLFIIILSFIEQIRIILLYNKFWKKVIYRTIILESEKGFILLGDFGTYQFRQFILHLLPAFTAGVHMMTTQIVCAVPDHRCRIPNVDLSPTTNFTVANLERYIPKSTPEKYDSCYMFNLTNDSKSLIKCESWVYDTTYHKSSRGMEWNFVCERQWMGAVAQSAFMFGLLVGVVTFGSASDIYGRKKILCWSALFQFIFGIAAAFVADYYTFIIVQFFYGAFGGAGCHMMAFVLCMELVGPSKRTICGTSLHNAFGVGMITVGLWGSFISNKQMLQLVFGLHGVLLLGHWWWLDESIRWLWANGKESVAIKIVQKGLNVNGSTISLCANDYLSKNETNKNEDATNVNLIDLFRTATLRRRTLIISFSWFANSLLYYGINLNAGKLTGNPFLLISIMGIVDIPAGLGSVFLMDHVGRRLSTSISMIIGGILCIIVTYLIKEGTAGTTLVMIAKLIISCSFAVIYNYSAELFPTVVRNSGLGFAEMCARLAGTITPLLYMLDKLHSTVSMTIFAFVSIISGFFVLFLPETLNSALPQTLDDCKNFKNDEMTFKFCCNIKDKTKNQVI